MLPFTTLPCNTGPVAGDYQWEITDTSTAAVHRTWQAATVEACISNANEIWNTLQPAQNGQGTRFLHSRTFVLLLLLRYISMDGIGTCHKYQQIQKNIRGLNYDFW